MKDRKGTGISIEGTWLETALMLICVLVVGVSVHLISPFLVLFLFLGIVGLFFALNYIEIFLLFAILIRSSLDALRDVLKIELGQFDINPASLLSIFIVLVGLLYFLVTKVSFRLNRVVTAYLIFLWVALIGVFNAFGHFGGAGSLALKEWIRLFSLFTLFLLIKNIIHTRQQIERIITIMFCSLAIPVSVAYYQLLTRSESTFSRMGAHRVYGTLVHPNPFALYLGFFLVITLLLFLAEKKMRYAALAVVLLIPFFATLSLTGIVMIVVSLMVVGMLKYRKHVVVGLIIISVIILSVAPLQERLSKLIDVNLKQEIETGEVSTSFSWRLYWWSLVWTKAKAKPVLGYGLHTAELVDPREGEGMTVFAPHNDFLRVTLELGFLGLMAYVYLLAAIGIWIWRCYKQIEDDRNKNFALGILTIYIAFITGSFASNFLTATVFQYYLWSSLGVLSVMMDLENKNLIKKRIY